jgi:hypothetical protein
MGPTRSIPARAPLGATRPSGRLRCGPGGRLVSVAEEPPQALGRAGDQRPLASSSSREHWSSSRGPSIAVICGRRSARSSLSPMAARRPSATTFGFRDAVLLSDPPDPFPPQRKFFTETIVAVPPEGGVSRIAVHQARWEQVAAIAADFTDLRGARMGSDEREGAAQRIRRTGA